MDEFLVHLFINNLLTMKHFKKYWWAYLLLAIAIYWYFFFSFWTDSRYETWKKNRNQAPSIKSMNDPHPTIQPLPN